MVIYEMTTEECREALAGASVARLCCELDGQPYVVPVYIAYDGTYLFGFSTMGQKVDWMRANPLVCVEIDDIKGSDRWMSLVVFGSYEELPDTPEYEAARAHAYEMLRRRVGWWEPASVEPVHADYSKPLSPIFYRIHIGRITGRRGAPDPDQERSAPRKVRSWPGKLLDRVLLR